MKLGEALFQGLKPLLGGQVARGLKPPPPNENTDVDVESPR